MPPSVLAGIRMVVLAVPFETFAVTGFPTIAVPFITMKVTVPALGLTEPLVRLALRATDWDALAL